MPPFSWPPDAMTVAGALGDDASRYVMWTVWAVDGLYYLDDLDQEAERARRVAAGHDDASVDAAHVRWAGTSAITALDLCAAAMGVIHAVPVLRNGQVVQDRVHDVEGLRPHRSDLCDGCRAWLTNVVRDGRYKILKRLRDPMTHRTLPRLLSVTVNAAPGADSNRLGFSLSGSPGGPHTSARELIEVARDCATRHALAFIDAARVGAL
jgi:hypothetical protein